MAIGDQDDVLTFEISCANKKTLYIFGEISTQVMTLDSVGNLIVDQVIVTNGGLIRNISI